MFNKPIITVSAILTSAVISFCSPLSAKDSTKNERLYGIVNFQTCMTQSEYGKKEQSSVEAIRNQIISLMTQTEKELNEIKAKLDDSDYLDSLSPEAEQELKVSFNQRNEELMQYQNQSLQIMQQANMQFIHIMDGHIKTASQIVAKKTGIPMIMRQEACSFYDDSLDITNDIIKVMDSEYKNATEQTEAKAANEAIDKKK